MESSTNTSDYKSWARNVPLYVPVKQEAPTTSSTPKESQETKWWRFSAVQDFFTSFFPRLASLVPEESQQRRWPRLLAFKESIASFFLRPTIEIVLFLLALIFLLVAAIVFRSGFQARPKAINPHSPNADCLRIISSASSLESFPLPYQVDLKVHEAILNVNSLPDLERLTLLNHTHYTVCSVLASTAQALVGYVANASEIYLPLPNGDTMDAFSTNTLSISQQFHIAASQVESLEEEYGTLQKDYDTLEKKISEGSKAHEMRAIPRFLVYAQPGGVVQQVGVLDAHEAFLGPVEARKTAMGKKLLSGAITLARERERVIKINSVVKEVDRVLQVLTEVVRDSGASSLKSKAGRDVIRRRVKEWYEKHVIQNSQLKGDWEKLIRSVDTEEKKERRALSINITREWCYASSSTRYKRIIII